ncbi:FliA/WhiG family RNA polymerase sigma factor [Nocardioides mangrovicus]|uniref:FliA/WhiG family RNA polymerase sigma factor n=1 Tax=Nocardioides mangrovicus TaxID=2478913 RepID=A0A3L8P1J8_9ACTN|nr:FliA/WhiG family RNA polymerase sigma factor [Nocardioides mangrovicus]RLV48792.1 FliA/WhiG family RNA polymerase sigma factor [Nocardioides mangrovicus]
MFHLVNAQTPVAPVADDIDELVSAHLPLVAHAVREAMARVPAHVDRDDLTSAGMFALVQAARSFDTARGVPFAGYASTRVRGAILDELRSIDWASRSVRRKARAAEEVRQQLATALRRLPSSQEVAAALGITTEELARNEDDISRAQLVSIHETEREDIENLLPTAGPTPEQVVQDRERMTYMVEAVAELPERLRVVVEQYFLAERPMADIAAELGVTESRVSQMRGEALVLLRGALHRALDPELAPAETGTGCAVRRRESYYAAVAARHASGLERHHTPMRIDATA